MGGVRDRRCEVAARSGVRRGGDAGAAGQGVSGRSADRGVAAGAADDRRERDGGARWASGAGPAIGCLAARPGAVPRRRRRAHVAAPRTHMVVPCRRFGRWPLPARGLRKHERRRGGAGRRALVRRRRACAALCRAAGDRRGDDAGGDRGAVAHRAEVRRAGLAASVLGRRGRSSRSW